MVFCIGIRYNLFNRFWMSSTYQTFIVESSLTTCAFE